LTSVSSDFSGRSSVASVLKVLLTGGLFCCLPVSKVIR
jgi:hypothetical protein